jgi:hypothetical protein
MSVQHLHRNTLLQEMHHTPLRLVRITRSLEALQQELSEKNNITKSCK